MFSPLGLIVRPHTFPIRPMRLTSPLDRRVTDKCHNAFGVLWRNCTVDVFKFFKGRTAPSQVQLLCFDFLNHYFLW